MRKALSVFTVAVLAFLLVTRAKAQTPLSVPGDAVMGHVHLLVSDVDANKKFWLAMGGAPVTLGSGATAIEGVVFGNVRVLLRKADDIQPAVGSGINHFGLYVPNVKAAMAKWKDMGLKTEAGRNDQQGFVWTPGDLVRVEILEMPGQSAPVVFHHVHLFVTANSAGGIPEMQAWYKRVFGAVPGTRGAYDTDNVPGGELTFTKSDTPVVPTMGRAVDHFGFNVKNLEAFCKKLEANGIKLDMPYTKRPDLGLSLAFITDPWGTRIELNEPLM